ATSRSARECTGASTSRHRKPPPEPPLPNHCRARQPGRDRLMSPDEARPGAHPYAREVVRIDPAARSGTASQITYRLLTEWGKLGAVATALLPAFYGEMRDAFNLGDVTDRLETHWRLTSPRVLRALDGQRPDDQETRPIVRRITIPWNYHELRASDAGDAATCR